MTQRSKRILAAATALLIAAPAGNLYALTPADAGADSPRPTDCATSPDPRCKDTLKG